jgi:hypothetical protein
MCAIAFHVYHEGPGASAGERGADRTAALGRRVSEAGAKSSVAAGATRQRS